MPLDPFQACLDSGVPRYVCEEARSRVRGESRPAKKRTTVRSIPQAAPQPCALPRPPGPGCSPPRVVTAAAYAQGGSAIGGELWCADYRCLESADGKNAAGPPRRFYLALLNAGLYGVWYAALRSDDPGLRRAAWDARRWGSADPCGHGVGMVRNISAQYGLAPHARLPAGGTFGAAFAGCETSDCESQNWGAPGADDTICGPAASLSPGYGEDPLPALPPPGAVQGSHSAAGGALLAVAVGLGALLLLRKRT